MKKIGRGGKGEEKERKKKKKPQAIQPSTYTIQWNTFYSLLMNMSFYLYHPHSTWRSSSVVKFCISIAREKVGYLWAQQITWFFTCGKKNSYVYIILT